MSLNVEKGVITAETSTGAQVYTLAAAAGFDIKALMLWTTRQTAAGAAADAVMAFGFGSYDGAVVQQAYVHFLSLDAQGASAVSGGINTTAILKGNSGDNVADFEIDLTLLDDNQFTLDYVDAPAAAIKIHYLALGGDDITAARGFSFTDDGTNPQDVTIAAGFGQPDLLLLGASVGTAGDTAGAKNIMLSAASSNSARRTTNWREADASDPVGVASTQQAFALIAQRGSIDETADLAAKASWPTDGFRLDKTISTARTDLVIGLALKGTFQSRIGATGAPITGSTPVVVDIDAGFAPKGALLWGSNLTAQTGIVSNDADLGSFGIGATDGTNEGWAACSEDDAAATSQTNSYWSETKTIQHHTPVVPSLVSECDGSFSGDNLRLSWNDIDTVERETNYLVLGDAEVGGGGGGTSGLTWEPPPGWQVYTHYTLPSAGGVVTLPSPITDYFLVNPADNGGIITKCLTIKGGRNVVWIGGRVKVDTAWSDNENTQSGVRVYDADSGSVNGRVVHLEGILVDGTEVGDGFQMNADTAVVQIQNCRNVQGYDFTTGVHPDGIQPWGGVKELRVDQFTCLSKYQGLMLKEDLGPVGPIWLRRVNVRDSGADVSRYLWWLNTAQDRVYCEDVYLNNAAGRTFGKSIWPDVDDTTASRRPTIDTDADGEFATYPTLTNNGGQLMVRTWDDTAPGELRHDDPPDGDYCPAGTPGIAYVSPGYGTVEEPPPDPPPDPDPTPPPGPTGRVTFFPLFPLILTGSEIFTTAAVTNDGQGIAWPIWRITGPGSDLVLKNLTTNKVLSVSAALAGSDLLIIDTRPGIKTITDGEGNNLLGASVGPLWELARGVNELEINLTGASVDSQVELTYRRRWLTA